MKTLIPFPPWPFGPKRPEFYLCTCVKCGHKQTCVVSDCEVISLNDGDTASEHDVVHVTALPEICPKCGGKLKRKKMPSLIKY